MSKLLLVLAALLCVTSPLRAQVTVDLRALNALPGAAPTPQRPAVHPSTATPPAPRAAVSATTPPAASAAAPASTAAGPTTAASVPAPVIPTPGAPPPAAAVPADTSQVAALPTATLAPPPAATAPAPTTATPRPSTDLRIGFPAEAVELSADDTAALKQLAGGVPNSDSATFNVIGYAAAKGDDPSSARRVSLSRAMAVRTALIANGVPSARIYVRALGAQTDATPADRVDISVMGANTGSAGR